MFYKSREYLRLRSRVRLNFYSNARIELLTSSWTFLALWLSTLLQCQLRFILNFIVNGQMLIRLTGLSDENSMNFGNLAGSKDLIVMRIGGSVYVLMRGLSGQMWNERLYWKVTSTWLKSSSTVLDALWRMQSWWC